MKKRHTGGGGGGVAVRKAHHPQKKVSRIIWMALEECVVKNSWMKLQAALVIRGGYVPRIYREYQNRE